MKKVFLLISLVLFIIPQQTFAQTSPNVDKTIDQLKDKVASKVAQLNLVQKKGIIGVVTDISGKQITLDDLNGKKKIVEADELTEYSSDEIKNFELSDIKKGMNLSILGLYNKDSERLLARFITDTSLPVFYRGVITDKDTKNFTVNLSTEDGESYVVDIENVTKAFEYNDDNLDTSGFTKMPTMVNAIVVGFPNDKEKNRITAARIITFPGVPKNPKVPIEENPNETQAPSPAPTK